MGDCGSETTRERVGKVVGNRIEGPEMYCSARPLENQSKLSTATHRLVYQPSFLRGSVVIGASPLLPCAYPHLLIWPLSAFWAPLLPMRAQLRVARPWVLVLCTLTPSSTPVLSPLQSPPSLIQTRMRSLGTLFLRSSGNNILEITVLPCARTLTRTRPLASPMCSSAR